MSTPLGAPSPFVSRNTAVNPWLVTTWRVWSVSAPFSMTRAVSVYTDGCAAADRREGEGRGGAERAGQAEGRHAMAPVFEVDRSARAPLGMKTAW